MAFTGDLDIDIAVFARRTNYTRLDDAMDILVPNGGFYTCRPHFPMLGGCVCIGYVEGEQGVTWSQTARMQVIRTEDKRAEIAIDDIRRDSNGKRLDTGLIRFANRLAVPSSIDHPLDGFVVGILPDGHHELNGLRAGADVELPGITIDDADAFAFACLIALENRSDALQAQPIEQTA